MAHIEIKTIKNHDYVYVRQSYRVGNKIRHKHIAYLGAVNPLRNKNIGISVPSIPSIPSILSIPSIPSIPSIRKTKREIVRYKGLSGKGYTEGKERKPIHITKKLKNKIKKRIIKKKLKELKKEKQDINDNLFKFFSI